MDALRTDDLTSPIAPFLAASLVIHVLLVFLLPVASIEVPERPAPPSVAPAEPGAEDLATRGLLAPLGSLRMQVLELAVPLPAPALPPTARSLPETAPSDVEVVPSPAVAAEAPPAEAAGTSPDVRDGAAAGEPGAPGALGQAEGTETGGGAEGRVGAGIISPPVIVAMVWPEFPKAAKRQLKVPIVLAVHVTAEGDVDQVEVETPSGCPTCEAAAIASAWQLRFQPATRDGVPIALWTRFPVVFGQR